MLLEEFYESHESGTGLSPQSGVAGVVDSDPSVQTAQLLLRPSMGAEVVDADLLPRLIAREVVELVEYRCGDESMTVYQRP